MIYVIQASSAGFDGGDYASITINDQPVKVEPNINGHYRGLHIAIVNPFNGKV